MGNRIISHPLRHMGLSRDQRCSKGSETIKWVEPPLRGGRRCLSFLSFFFFAIFHPFLSGVSNWASESEEIATSINSHKKASFFFQLYMNWGKSQLGTDEQARRWFYVFPCLYKTIVVCVCVGGAGSHFPCHMVVLVKMLSLVPELVSKCRAKPLLTHSCCLVAKWNLFSTSRTRWPCATDAKRKKLRASDLLGILHKTNRHPPISSATKKGVWCSVKIWENLQLLILYIARWPHCAQREVEHYAEFLNAF